MIAAELIQSLRPKQWLKNGFIAAALIFSNNLFNPGYVIITLIAIASFSLVSSALYILNDLVDIEEDRLHPLKSERPLASGRLTKGTAIILMALLTVAGTALALVVNLPFAAILLGYILLQVAYSVKLKHVVILDIFAIAAGFMVRVIAGGLAIRVEISEWLVVCTALISLFLAMGKRRHELVLLNKDAAGHRPILREYSPYLLDQMISVVTASTLVAYCLYTISETTVAKFGTRKLVYTIPFVLYGIFRYLYLIHKKEAGGSPEFLVTSDLPLLAAVFFWILTAVVIIYWR